MRPNKLRASRQERMVKIKNICFDVPFASLTDRITWEHSALLFHSRTWAVWTEVHIFHQYLDERTFSETSGGSWTVEHVSLVDEESQKTNFTVDLVSSGFSACRTLDDLCSFFFTIMSWLHYLTKTHTKKTITSENPQSLELRFVLCCNTLSTQSGLMFPPSTVSSLDEWSNKSHWSASSRCAAALQMSLFNGLDHLGFW